MKTVLAGALFSTAAVALCQTPSKESDTLQSLLSEVHQLRQSIEAMTVASQRVQIALYGLQVQEAAVNRTTQRLDTARSKCTTLEQNRRQLTSEIQRMESTLASGDRLEGEASSFKLRLPSLKNGLEEMTAEFQACQTAEAEVSNQLRNDQAKLLELQDRVDRLDKSLEKLSSSGK